MTDRIQGDRFEVSVTDDGVVRLVLADEVEITVGDAEAIVDAIASLTAGVRSPVLADLRSVGPVRRPARKVFSDANIASRAAILVGSPVSRVLANFGLGLNRPANDVPLKIFEDEASARRWLLDHAGGT